METRQLHDFKDGVAVELAPVTVFDAVVDPDTGENLTGRLSALKDSVPVATSELENDSDFATNEGVAKTYLPLAGGVLSNGSRSPLRIEGDGTGAGIGFSKSPGDSPAYLLFRGGSDWAFAAPEGEETAAWHSGNLDGDALSSFMAFHEGANSAEGLSDIPVDKRLCVCSSAESGPFSLASLPPAGREIHVIVANAGTEDIAVALPTTGSYVCMSGTALAVKAGGYAEINVISDGSRMYIRSV